MARCGARPPTAEEEGGAHAFYATLGHLLGLDRVPGSYQELAELIDAFERRSFRATSEGHALCRAARRVFEERLPAPVTALGPAVAECLMDLMDPSVRVIGVPRRPRALRIVAACALRSYVQLCAAGTLS
jgi:hypothetical protein